MPSGVPSGVPRDCYCLKYLWCALWCAQAALLRASSTIREQRSSGARSGSSPRCSCGGIPESAAAAGAAPGPAQPGVRTRVMTSGIRHLSACPVPYYNSTRRIPGIPKSATRRFQTPWLGYDERAARPAARARAMRRKGPRAAVHAACLCSNSGDWLP